MLRNHSTIISFEMNWLGELCQKYINLDDTVLDVGCGIHHTIEGLQCKSYLGCDVWMKYLAVTKQKQNVVRIDATKDLDRFPDKSYDVVLCLDVLEHVTLGDAEKILEHLKRICRKYVIIFTPSEFKDNESAVLNAWDLGECDYQRHRCLLTTEILMSHGFKVTDDNTDWALFGVYNGNGF